MCTCPSKSWFSMKSWNASLLLSLLSSPPSLSARVLNGQYFLLWMGTNLTQFLMYKKLRLKESFVFLERRQPKKYLLWCKLHLELCFLALLRLPSPYISPALTRVWSYQCAALESQSPEYFEREALQNIQPLAKLFIQAAIVCRNTSRIIFLPFGFPWTPAL